MRQREITWQGWRVSWPDVDGGRHSITSEVREFVEYEAARTRKAGVADVRVYRVTRYRLAPLVEIAAWSRDSTAQTAMLAGAHDSPGASVEHYMSGWAARVWVGDAFVLSRGHRTRRAAMVAAEAHLAVLGYRAKKEKRR